MRIAIAAAVAAGLAAAAAHGASRSPAPDLRACPRTASPEKGDRERKAALPVPAALRPLVRASLDKFAVATLVGRTVCVDTGWVERVERMALSPDRRFLSFSWNGYESYGFTLVDRIGRGKVIEVGVPPVFSPSRRQFAAIDQTESEFGSLSGLKIWRVTPTAVIEAGAVDDIARMYDWRIDGWVGESCLNLSAVPHELIESGRKDVARPPRRRFVTRRVAGGWQVQRMSGANRCRA